ncbi:MAG TPA: O-antigen ligase family protein [Candidatus Moranbacteria bacterium]|nr:O-antigen ligase family protein [Candidatus Moranbacteria bacterium]HRZ33596.1 O-antigen ligase family protein [Candidatus Moranbacteria bacterium]
MNKILSIENFFCLVIFSLPLYLYRLSLGGISTNLFEILAVSVMFFSFFKRKKLFINDFYGLPKYFIASVVLVVTGVLFSILLNNSYASGFSIFKSWFILPIIFSFMLYVFLDSEIFLEKIFMTIFLSTALVGAISIVYKILGIVTYDNRLQSFYLSPNYLAMYIAPGIFFGFYFLAKSFRKNAYGYGFFTNVFLLLLVLSPLYYTYSYGAWMAACTSFLVLIVLAAKKRKFLFIAIFLLTIAAAFVLQINSPKFLDLFSERSSWASRTMVWKASVLMIKQNPVWGVGPGNFQTNYLSLQKYFPPYLQWAVPEPHNIFLAFWIQTGLLGLAGFLFLLFYVFRILLDILRDNKKNAAFAAPIFGFFLYTVLHGLIDTPYWKNDLSFLFWVCVFLTLVVYKKYKH